MLAHVCAVWAGAGEANFRWFGEQALLLSAKALHNTVGEPALQEFNQGIDSAGAIRADRAPLAWRQRLYGNDNLVDRRSADQRFDLQSRYLEIDYQPIADVRPTAGQSVLVVAIAFQIVAPRLPPKRSDDFASLDRDRRD